MISEELIVRAKREAECDHSQGPLQKEAREVKMSVNRNNF